MTKPKRKKCWLCGRVRAAKFFPAHNKISKVSDETISTSPGSHKAMADKLSVYIHTILRIESQAPKSQPVCVDCLDDVRESMVGAVT